MTRVPESTALVALRRELHAHIHARIGEAAFGTTPGEAELMATLRSDREEVLDRLREESVHRAQRVSESNGLELTHSWTESFPVTFNHPEAVAPQVPRCRNHRQHLRGRGRRGTTGRPNAWHPYFRVGEKMLEIIKNKIDLGKAP